MSPTRRHAIPATSRCTPSAASGTARANAGRTGARASIPASSGCCTSTPARPSGATLAERYSRPLEPRRFDRTVHDLGFLFFSTYLRWYHLTGDPRAARRADRRRPDAGPAPAEGRLPGVVRRAAIAVHRHHDERRHHLLGRQRHRRRRPARDRPGALPHDAANTWCAPTAARRTRASSTWTRGVPAAERRTRAGAPTAPGTRGLAWAIYGFTAVHRLSGEAEFLDTARRCADCYLRRTPPGLVPPWDFDVPPDGPHLWDSSAGAIAASGLWDLAEAGERPGRRRALPHGGADDPAKRFVPTSSCRAAGRSGRAS